MRIVFLLYSQRTALCCTAAAGCRDTSGTAARCALCVAVRFQIELENKRGLAAAGLRPTAAPRIPEMA